MQPQREKKSHIHSHIHKLSSQPKPRQSIKKKNCSSSSSSSNDNDNNSSGTNNKVNPTPIITAPSPPHAPHSPRSLTHKQSHNTIAVITGEEDGLPRRKPSASPLHCPGGWGQHQSPSAGTMRWIACSAARLSASPPRHRGPVAHW